MVIARSSSSMLLRRAAAVAAPRSLTTTIPYRPFTTTIAARAERRRDGAAAAGPQEAQPRTNPLVGRFTPKPVADTEPPPVSTEHPRASKPPHPSRPPTSSAEVPPNADMPLPTPPPPPPPPASSAPSSQTAGTGAARARPNHPYDAAAPSSEGARLDVSTLASIGGLNVGRSQDRHNTSDPTQRPSIRSRASTGRTVFVADRSSAKSAPTPNMAFMMLDRLVKSEGVRTKYHSQKFHERGGMKRKRLRSQRWRRRFKEGFRATMLRVLELKRQGW